MVVNNEDGIISYCGYEDIGMEAPYQRDLMPQHKLKAEFKQGEVDE